VYAKHRNFVDVDASGAKSGTKYLELRLEVIQCVRIAAAVNHLD